MTAGAGGKAPSVSAVEAEISAYLAEQLGGSGAFDISRALRLRPGRLYPALCRLETAGLVRSWWGDPVRPDGPRRRLYALAAGGTP